jgi:hypothetical protein
MNTYSKYAPNVFLAKCTEKHEKGETILVETKYGKENESIIFNLIYEKDGLFFYSIVRADGFNFQEHAKRRAEKLNGYATKTTKKSDDYYQKSNKDKDFLCLGEPIKIGHHSEKRHRKIIEQAQDNMQKSFEYSKKANEYENRVKYWEERASQINLSMPESIEYYEFKFEEAIIKHEGMKNGTISRDHSYSLTYAKKNVNEAKKNLELAKKLWA